MQQKAPLKIVKASAGSGKTFNLTLHYITLLLHRESSYREILAVTFTNKATAEMKHRILSVLRGLAQEDQTTGIGLYRDLLLKDNPSWTAALIAEKAQRIYRQILHDYSRFTVSTIDGFSQKVIRSFTYELNLEATYMIEMNTNKVRKDLTLMLNELLDERADLLDWIIQYAEQRIDQNENWNYRQQLMKLAGLIFSENFQEFDAHLASAEPDIFNQLNEEIESRSTTFIKALQDTLDNFTTAYQNLSIDPSELAQKTRNKLVKAGLKRLQADQLSIRDIQKEVFVAMAELGTDERIYISTDKSKQIRYDIQQAIRPHVEAFHRLAPFFSQYIADRAVKEKLYYLRLLKEMSDLLGKWRKLSGAQLISDAQVLLSRLGLDENNDPTFIWEKIGNRYRYFLFDEFQDTSRLQWKNYSPLLLNALSTPSGQVHEHLVVGDVKQSIYRWRNGDWRILLHQVEESIVQNFHLSATSKNDFIEEATLDTNYRSSPQIIALNNYIFTALPQQLQELLNQQIADELGEDEQQWWQQTGNHRMLIEAYQHSAQKAPQQLPDQQAQGRIEIEYLPPENGQYRATKVRGASLEKLCDKIGEWIGSGRYRPDQIGILVRENKEAKLIIDALMAHKAQHGLAYDVVSGDAMLLQSNHAIELLLETMRAMAFPSEKHLIHRAKIVYLLQALDEVTQFDSQIWLKIKSNRLDELTEILPAALIDQWEQLQRLPLSQLLERLIEIYQLGRPGSKHLPYLLAFKDVTTQFVGRGERGLIHFLEYWADHGDRATLPNHGKLEAVEITTIHKSKGLAYDVVMVPFAGWMIDGKPSSEVWFDVDESPFHAFGKIPLNYNKLLGSSSFYRQYYEEKLFNYMDSLNTLYVAMTRARQHIYITAPLFVEKSGGLERKNEYITDALFHVLEAPAAPFPMKDYRIDVSEPGTGPRPVSGDQRDSTNRHVLALANYPTSDILGKAFHKPVARDITEILSQSGAARYGLLAHEIISEVQTHDEIDQRIKQFLEEGLVNPAEIPLLRDEISAIWFHPTIKTWFAGNYKIWSESSIITADGQTLRPDKVFTREQEAIVLDFKFTKGDYIGHKTQVAEYMNALYQVGYDEIKGFLYYAKNRELVQVI